MMLGEVSPGGDGSGLYGKLILVLTAVFIAGLMVGRTPEYLGKKIQSQEMKLVVVYLLAVPLVTLAFAGCGDRPAIGAELVVVVRTARADRDGLLVLVLGQQQRLGVRRASAPTPQWYNTTLGITMLVGRFFTIIPVLAIGGSLVRKQVVPATAGTFRTDTPLFLGLLLAVTVIIVGLIYFPVVALGPIVEHLAGHF